MVSASAADTSGSRGLSCLEAVQRKLAEDRNRSVLTSASGLAASRPLLQSQRRGVKNVSEPCTDDAAGYARCGEVVARVATAPHATGGGVRAVSYLKVMDCGRTADDKPPLPVGIEVLSIDVEAAVTHPEEPSALEEMVAPPAPRSPAPTRPAPRGGVRASAQSIAVDSTSRGQSTPALPFHSDPENFGHILRFMREGKNFQAPETAESRKSLREEAIYFGCMGLVGHLDSGCAEDKGAEGGSALAANLADLSIRPPMNEQQPL